MPVYNQSRSRVIQIIFIAVFLIIIAQLLHLQIFSDSYRMQAESNAVFRKVIYPDRGIIYDRKGKAVLENTVMFDLWVTPREIKGTDTLAMCGIMGITREEFNKKIVTSILKNSSYKPSVFEPLLSPELYARLNENMYKFPGFVLQERPVRAYPFNAAANILGYIGEVDTNFLKRHKDEGYEMGDYTGMTGLERSYERVLMGERGIKRFLRDNHSRLQGSYENGEFDTTAVAGRNLHLSLDVELQQLGEKLMNNKVGSIVAIDPKTGGVLCMVSSPTYNPNYLTGPERRKHFSDLFTDPRLPLLNRAVNASYSPGSTFKTVVGIVGLTEGVIDENTTVSCPGAYYGCGRRMGCLDPGTFQIRGAIAHSCNTFFATTFRRIMDQQQYGRADSNLSNFNRYAYSFGLGNKLGVDIPSERRGNVPTPNYYKKIFGPRWVSCNIISNSIGQGEVETTLSQLANVMAIIANKGWYYTPHLVDSIEGGDSLHLLDTFRIKHRTLDVPDEVFNVVQDGMQNVMEFGTGAAAKVPGVTVCGKTGTVQNPFGKDHAFFGAFAPRENPRIAIAVMCENAGFGASSAAPIASLMIEKYLKDSIAGPERNKKADYLSTLNLIPERMRKAMKSMDSLRRIKDSIQLKAKEQKQMKDTIDVEEQPELDIHSRNNRDTASQKLQLQATPNQQKSPVRKISTPSPAILDEEQKKNNRRKTIRT